MFSKSPPKRRRFALKSVTTNEPTLGCHHFLPTWLLHRQVCTPTKCIETIYEGVSKKWREKEEICLQKRDNERAPSRVSSLLTFMAASQPSLYTYPVYRNHLCRCFQKVARKGGDFLKKRDNEWAPFRVSSLLTCMAASQPSLYTYQVYRNHLRKVISKSSAKRRRFALKSVTTNEPPLGCHHFLPAWLLHSQVCTPTKCIETIYVGVSKKWREKEEICLKKRDNEWAPSRVSSTLTFMAALQPSFYTYPVYRTLLCKCFQKVARKGGDLP